MCINVGTFLTQSLHTLTFDLLHSLLFLCTASLKQDFDPSASVLNGADVLKPIYSFIYFLLIMFGVVAPFARLPFGMQVTNEHVQPASPSESFKRSVPGSHLN